MIRILKGVLIRWAALILAHISQEGGKGPKHFSQQGPEGRKGIKDFHSGVRTLAGATIFVAFVALL